MKVPLHFQSQNISQAPEQSIVSMFWDSKLKRTQLSLKVKCVAALFAKLKLCYLQ